VFGVSLWLSTVFGVSLWLSTLLAVLAIADSRHCKLLGTSLFPCECQSKLYY